MWNVLQTSCPNVCVSAGGTGVVSVPRYVRRVIQRSTAVQPAGILSISKTSERNIFRLLSKHNRKRLQVGILVWEGEGGFLSNSFF